MLVELVAPPLPDVDIRRPWRKLPLTLSGNEITDALRALAVEGDGLSRRDSSFGIWEATTNLVINGGFETNTTGWSIFQSTIARSTDQAKFGSASLKVTWASGGGFTAHKTITISGATAGRIYAFSIWVFAEGNAVNQTLQMEMKETGGVAGTAITIIDITAVASWQRIAGTITVVENDRTGVLISGAWPSGASSTADYFYMDGVQIELQPIVTPYVETDGGAASRGAAQVQIPVAGIFDETQSWVAMRMRVNWDYDGEPADWVGVFQWSDDATHSLTGYFNQGTDTFSFERKGDGSGSLAVQATTHTKGDIITLVFAWTATQVKLSLNGGSFAVGANSDVPTLSAAMLYIGEGSKISDCDIFWFACGKGTLTDADAATIHAFGNADVQPQNFPGTPTAMWDAGSGMFKKMRSAG